MPTLSFCVPVLSLGLLVASVEAQQLVTGSMPVVPPRSAFNPPGAKEMRSLAESTQASPQDLLTVAEKTRFAETGRYADSVVLARKLEQASPWVKTVRWGTTPQGREMIAMVVSKDRAFTPEAAAKTGKAIVWLQSCIHPGEVDGKEASEMLVRDMVATKRFAAWLDKLIFVVIPVFNIDGHERLSPYNRINQDGPNQMGFRATATRLNLNRDYVKADAPEMRAWLGLFNAWVPDFLIDNHVTDGMDMQYDVTIDIPQNQDLAEPVSQWVRERYSPLLYDLMSGDGHLMAPYGGLVQAGMASAGGQRRPGAAPGYYTGYYGPRYTTGYAAAQNRPSLLVETHSLKSFQVRSWAHYDIMRRSIEILLRDPQELRRVVRAADESLPKQAGMADAPKAFLAGRTSPVGRPFTFKAVKTVRESSTVTGGEVTRYLPEPVDIPTTLFDKLEVTASASVPVGYLIPVEWQEMIALLAVHGIKTERVPREITGEFETYRFTDVKFAPAPFEGRIGVTYKTTPATERRVLAAGSVFVPMAQRRARLAMAMLEPESEDSLLAWGFMHSVFEQKEYFSEYVMEPIAQRMLSSYPDLRREYERKLASDTAFAGNPRARLMWLFEQSPYQEQDRNAYPVVRVMRKTW